MKKRLSKSPYKDQATRYWRDKWNNWPMFDHETTYYRERCTSGLRQIHPKLRVKEFHFEDYGFMCERHCPRWWKNLHIREHRRKMKKYIFDVLQDKDVVPPILYKPWRYYW